jgi:hypothetical protein
VGRWRVRVVLRDRSWELQLRREAGDRSVSARTSSGWHGDCLVGDEARTLPQPRFPATSRWNAKEVADALALSHRGGARTRGTPSSVARFDSGKMHASASKRRMSRSTCEQAGVHMRGTRPAAVMMRDWPLRKASQTPVRVSTRIPGFKSVRAGAGGLVGLGAGTRQTPLLLRSRAFGTVIRHGLSTELQPEESVQVSVARPPCGQGTNWSRTRRRTSVRPVRGPEPDAAEHR